MEALFDQRVMEEERKGLRERESKEDLLEERWGWWVGAEE